MEKNSFYSIERIMMDSDSLCDLLMYKLNLNKDNKTNKYILH